MADGSRAQNERTGATSPESATRIQQATSKSPSSQLRSNTTVFGSACIEGRPNPNFRLENEICGSTICYCLAYGSLLRNINQAGWETGVSSISQMLQLWKGSVRDLEQKLGDVDFDTLEAVDPGHRCSLEDIGSSFFNCNTESDIAQQDNIRRAFGRCIARHRGPAWGYTDSLAGSTLVNLSEGVSRL
ncbi:hypothetical protein TWF594_007640 [Orbilia oligospora]|uniref:Uncharacterized protein n=1 Tax=Orbilia oligospora TaxID=2813651 RepID=A0A7C8JX24_ORBOL|nr:hypothetical protein TWF594_007640 [Orbilia oligospora]KAF3137243.1 hypothetical protein TWF703_005166 [Orbilia oligospora]